MVIVRNVYKKQSPGVETAGLLVKALISSYFESTCLVDNLQTCIKDNNPSEFYYTNKLVY